MSHVTHPQVHMRHPVALFICCLTAHQVQLDDVPLPDETILPRQLAMINLNLPPKRPGQQGTAVHLAQLPVDPTTGKRPPLLYLSRYNSTWFEVLAALHVAVLEGKLEQMPKVYLCAQAAGGQGSHSSHTGDGSDAVIEEVAPTLALARLQELCLLRSVTCAALMPQAAPGMNIHCTPTQLVDPVSLHDQSLIVDGIVVS